MLKKIVKKGSSGAEVIKTAIFSLRAQGSKASLEFEVWAWVSFIHVQYNSSFDHTSLSTEKLEVPRAYPGTHRLDSFRVVTGFRV